MKKIISAILTVSMVFGMSTATFARPGYRPEGQRYQGPYKGIADQAVNRKKNDKANEKEVKEGRVRSDKTEGYRAREDRVRSEAVKEKKARAAARTAAGAAPGYAAGPEGSEASDAPDAAQKASKPQENDGKADAKSKAGLLNKCGDLASQISRLKGYIVSEDGSFLTKFKDRETGDAALKSIKDAAAKLEEYREHINTAASNKELNTIKDDLQKNFMKHQTIVKRVTGLTSAARLREAYDGTKALVDKLGAGINGITADAGVSLDVEALKKRYAEIADTLKEAYNNYLEANAMFSTMEDSAGDKAFTAAHSKLMEAKDGLHDVLAESRRLLAEIKTGAHS